MITELVRKILHEISWICSKNASSILKSKDDATLLSFEWELIIGETKQSTPLFYSLLQKLFGTSQQANISIGTVYAIACHSQKEIMTLYFSYSL